MDLPWTHHAPAISPFHFPTLPAGASSHISLVGIQPEAGPKVIQDIIASATKSLWIEMYLFDNDHVAQMLLKQKATYHNLDLRLLYHQPDLPPSLDPTGTRRFPAWASHNRGIRTDGQRLAFVGSQNLSHQSLHYSREVGILISNKSVVANLLATFNTDWKYAQDQASKIRHSR